MVKANRSMALPHDHTKDKEIAGRMNAVAAVVTAALLGIFVLYGAGFAGANVLHNAAHDGRHSFTFPCH